jgi:hypothetical protein
VDELFKQAESKGVGMRDIVVSICQSDVFRDSETSRSKQPEPNNRETP